MNRGLEQGLQQGLEQGRKEGFASLLMTLLSQRFGQVPDWVAQKLTTAPPETLESWSRRVFEARSLDEIFV